MDTTEKKIKLTEKDKKTILKNSDICTDSHGGSCSSDPKEKEKMN